MDKLKERPENILGFIKTFVAENQGSPTIREIQDGLDISSTSVVDYNLNILVREGYLSRGDFRSSRSIRLTAKSRAPGDQCRAAVEDPRKRDGMSVKLAEIWRCVLCGGAIAVWEHRQGYACRQCPPKPAHRK